MNTLDLYDYDGTIGSHTPPSREVEDHVEFAQDHGDVQLVQSQPAPPTLNEEVTQVMGQLGKLWGGFRKQGTTAFENARKDMNQVVIQAQRELGRITEPNTTPGVANPTNEPAEGGSAEEGSSSSITRSPPRGTIAQSANQLFSRLQSSLPPNLSSTLQKSLQNAQDNPAVHQMRNSFISGLHLIQDQTKGMSLTQAEEFVQHRSEILLKEAADFFKEAVKIVPPEETAAATGGVIWDGSDSWMVSTTDTASDHVGGKQGTRGKAPALRRADILLRRLRSESSIMLLDPATDPSPNVVGTFEKWKRDIGSPSESFSSENWRQRQQAALKDDGGLLLALHEQWVPSQMTDAQFWQRYFFRVYEIELDEERRKALLEGATRQDVEDDFSWEDDEDDSPLVPGSALRADSSTPTKAAIEPSFKNSGTSEISRTLATPHPTSPPLSEDSYDHISQTSGVRSRTSPGSSVVESAESRLAGTTEERASGAKQGDDDDSDWD